MAKLPKDLPSYIVHLDKDFRYRVVEVPFYKQIWWMLKSWVVKLSSRDTLVLVFGAIMNIYTLKLIAQHNKNVPSIVLIFSLAFGTFLIIAGLERKDLNRPGKVLLLDKLIKLVLAVRGKSSLDDKNTEFPAGIFKGGHGDEPIEAPTDAEDMED